MSNALLYNPTSMEAGLEAVFKTRTVTDAQQAAFARFAKLRMPNRRLEGWKWSDFNGALRDFSPINDAPAADTVASSEFASLNPLEFRIVDGRIELPVEEIPEGMRYGVIEPVATILELESHAIASLNVAMTRKALGIEVVEGAVIERPILIRHINTGAGFSFAQSMMRISPNAKAQLIETYEGNCAGFYSHLFHMVVRDGAEFNRTVVQETGPDNTLHALCAAKVNETAHFEQTSFSTGSRLARHETIAHFWSPSSSATINSAALLCGERHNDFTTHVVHKERDCETRQLHKGVARDRGRNVFQGKFEVERIAQKTDAKMTANALLLSEGAQANHKPELEIYADDVECAHGSTVGSLDEDALFYLRQRGLDEKSARAMLIEAFFGDVMSGVKNDVVRDCIHQKIKTWMETS